MSAHGGVDDGDDGEEGEGGGDVQGGTAPEELYPGYYEFQGRYVSFANTFSQIQAGRGGLTTTTPVSPFDNAPTAP
ncbi:MAG: hypothetical protein U0556_01395 [Dehalococcoidia bacterium]